MRQFLAGLSVSFAFIVGCLAGRIDADSSAVAAPEAGTATAPTHTTGPRFEYYCFRSQGGVTVAMNRMAADGWRLVTGTSTEAPPEGGSQGSRTVKPAWCMERPYEPKRQQQRPHPNTPPRY